MTIDDRLPCTMGGKVYYARCKDMNETWVPLMEKAYAKIQEKKALAAENKSLKGRLLERGSQISHRAGYFARRPFADLHPLEKALLDAQGVPALTQLLKRGADVHDLLGRDGVALLAPHAQHPLHGPQSGRDNFGRGFRVNPAQEGCHRGLPRFRGVQIGQGADATWKSTR